jgi:hypothetical protein
MKAHTAAIYMLVCTGITAATDKKKMTFPFRGLSSPHKKKQVFYKMLKRALDLDGFYGMM